MKDKEWKWDNFLFVKWMNWDYYIFCIKRDLDRCWCEWLTVNPCAWSAYICFSLLQLFWLFIFSISLAHVYGFALLWLLFHVTVWVNTLCLPLHILSLCLVVSALHTFLQCGAPPEDVLCLLELHIGMSGAKDISATDDWMKYAAHSSVIMTFNHTLPKEHSVHL